MIRNDCGSKSLRTLEKKHFCSIFLDRQTIARQTFLCISLLQNQIQRKNVYNILSTRMHLIKK